MVRVYELKTSETPARSRLAFMTEPIASNRSDLAEEERHFQRRYSPSFKACPSASAGGSSDSLLSCSTPRAASSSSRLKA